LPNLILAPSLALYLCSFYGAAHPASVRFFPYQVLNIPDRQPLIKMVYSELDGKQGMNHSTYENRREDPRKIPYLFSKILICLLSTMIAIAIGLMIASLSIS
jgi:hypothetical protein